MANELALKFQLTYTPSDANQLAIAPPLTTLTVTMAGNDHMSGIQSIGVTEEALALNEIGTLGYVMVRNLDASNTVNIHLTGETGTITLNGGEMALFRAAGALYATASGASTDIQYWAFEA